MATFPDLPQRKDSRLEPVNSTKVDIGANGSPRARVQYATTVFNGSIILDMLTTVQKEEVMTFYEDNKNLSFSFVWKADLATYSCIFVARPHPIWLSEDVWDVELKLVAALESEIPPNAVLYASGVVTHLGEIVTYG